ncbi:MAG: DASS family sodium-coupled anion symporter [Vicinamibacterales bacterium]
MQRFGRLAALVVLYAFIAYVLPRPEAVTPEGWRFFGIFIATIVGMMLQPLPGAALVIVGLTATTLNGTPMRSALGGFSEPSVWLVLAAMLMARVLTSTGMARRLALLFIRQFGGSSLGVGYALVFTDVTLAGGVPSITARSAGMVMPVGRSIAELFDSHPGKSAPRLGRFLFATMYQGSAIACAMFFTGQASNVLAANLAADLVGLQVTWTSWFSAAVVPGLASCLVVPWVVYRVLTPEVRRTPEAPAFAREQLAKMGRMSRDELMALAVFVSVGLLWLTSGVHGLDVTFVALAGLAVLIVAGTLKWETAVSERSAWDVFIWYGGLLRMGQLLNDTGVTQVFAESVGGLLAGIPWFALLVATLLIYFYTHYFFASITAHMLALFPPFLVLVTSLGVPVPLAVYSLMCLANLPAGLTHYGTTTGPILFSQDYVTFQEWWRAGFVVSVANLVIWMTIGFGWWKVLGLW